MTSFAASHRFLGFPRRHPLAVTGAAIAVICAIVIGVVLAHPRPWIEGYVGAALDRRLTIGALRIDWGRTLQIEATDLRLANTAGGSRPDMARVARIAAEIDPFAVFGGQPWLISVAIEKPDVVLERSADGTRNWQFGAAPATHGRTLLPAFLRARLNDGAVAFWTSSGALLRFGVRALDASAADSSQPVRIEADGSYNDTPVRLAIRAPSFDALRAQPGPLDVAFSATTATIELHFDGSMTDPLAFAGIDGALRADISDLLAALNLLGADATLAGAAIPLRVAGRFRRAGDRWDLADATGRLLGDDFTGAFSLVEAGRGQADEVDILARFARLELDPLVSLIDGGSAARPGTDAGAVALDFDEKRGTHFDVRVEATTLTHRSLELSDFALLGRLAADGARLDRLGFTFAGGVFEAGGSARPVVAGSRILGSAGIEDADVGQIARLLGIDGGQVSGRITARAEIELTGGTLDAALRTGRGHVVVAMTEGRIARRLLEMASTDVRSVFRRDERRTRISCLLAVASLVDTRAALSRLRLETPVTTLVGGGHVDVVARRLDVTVKSIAASTGFFALDIPIRISGPLARPRMDPLPGDPARWLDAGWDRHAQDELPPRLRQLVATNRCAR